MHDVLDHTGGIGRGALDIDRPTLLNPPLFVIFALHLAARVNILLILLCRPTNARDKQT